MTMIKGQMGHSTDAARRKAYRDQQALTEDMRVFRLLKEHQPLPAGMDHCEYRRDIEPSEAEMIADCILRK